MRISLLLLALAASAALPSCAQRHVPTTSQAAKPTFQKPRTVSTIPIHTFPNDTALVLQRTPCYGTCPAYTAVVFNSGKVSYHGDRFVPLAGDHTLSLDPTTVQAMREQARAINFNGLQHRYAGNTTDLPATIITSYLPGQPRYQVFAERGSAPQALQGYINYLQGKLDPLAGLNAER